MAEVRRNRALRSRHRQDILRALQNRELRRIPDVHRHVLVRFGESQNAVNLIAHVAEAARLLPVPYTVRASPRSACFMKLEITRPSFNCMRGP